MGRTKHDMTSMNTKKFKNKFFLRINKKRNETNKLKKNIILRNSREDQIQEEIILTSDTHEHNLNSTSTKDNDSIPQVFIESDIISESIPEDNSTSTLFINRTAIEEKLSSITDRTTTNYVALGLQKIAVSHNINRTAITDILKMLNPVIPKLPLDYRCLLSTPRTTDLTIVHPGNYVHFSIKQSLDSFKHKIEYNTIILNMFVDGLNIFKTSIKRSFWIIMANIDSVENSVFPIGVYYGEKKPEDFDVFLKSAVSELKQLIDEGLLVNGTRKCIEIKNFLLDTPARASVCGTAGHNAYESCPKCLCDGHYDGKMLFSEVDSERRTDDMFENRDFPNFHSRNSIVEKELKLKMVTQFPLDFLHVVLLGTTKRLLNNLLGPNKPKFPRSRDSVNEVIRMINLTIPSEIHRQIREIKDILTYKGHELRIFLLKVAPIVLKNNIPPDFYNHFLLLTCAFAILTDPDMCLKYNKTADKILKEFHENIDRIYQENMCVPMVHQTMHMAEEVYRQKMPCDNFCTWPFESFMTPLRRYVKTPNKPLCQIHRRIMELFNCPVDESTSNIPKYGKNYLIYQNFRLDTYSCRDRFLLTKNKDIVVVLDFTYENGIGFICKKLKKLNNFFTYPLDAQKLNYYYCSPTYTSEKLILRVTEIERKMFSMSYDSNIFFAPLSKFK